MIKRLLIVLAICMLIIFVPYSIGWFMYNGQFFKPLLWVSYWSAGIVMCVLLLSACFALFIVFPSGTVKNIFNYIKHGK